MDAATRPGTDASGAAGRLAAVAGITGHRGTATDERITTVLRAAAETLGTPAALVGRVDGDRYEVLHAWSSDDSVTEGAVHDPAVTFGRLPLEADGVVDVACFSRSEHRDLPAYQRFGFESFLGTAVHVEGMPPTTLEFLATEPRETPWEDPDRHFVAALGAWVGRVLEARAAVGALVDTRDHMATAAGTDDVTRVLNRRAILDRLDHEIARSRRYQRSMSVALIDIDRFEMLDLTSWPRGVTDVLRTVATVISGELRNVDHLGRYGGHEFLAILTEVDAPGAFAAAERLRRAAGSRLDRHGGRSRVTLSLGVSSLRTGDGADAVLDRASEALAAARRSGRDCVGVS